MHAAAEALEAIGITDQPLASIAKREEWIYVYGQESEPVVLDKFSPVLHLVQQVEKKLPLSRRNLWSESGENFVDLLTQALGEFPVN